MNGLILGAMMAVSMVQQTDTILEVDGAETLHVETLGGSIEISVWDEERIRVQAEHSRRTYIEIERRRNGREIDIEGEADRGPANLVDFRITVPRRMALSLDATYGDITVEGSDGSVEAETVQGDVMILGGRGTVRVEATTGSIYVDGADGRIEIESSAADIHVTNSAGEIYAESAGGTIVLEDVRPTAVDIGSTGGRLHYDGEFRPDGTYFFGAHGGSITIVVPEDAAVSFNVATVHGSISSNLRGEAEGLQRGERHVFEIGGGGALVEAETYGGRIRLLRRGTEGTAPPIRRRSPNRAPAPVAAAFGPSLAGEIGRRLTAEVSHRVTAEVMPWVTAQVSPHLLAHLAPRLDARLWTGIDAALAPALAGEMSRLEELTAPRPEAAPAAPRRR